MVNADNNGRNAAEIEGDPLASIGQRIVARAIDWLIVLAVSLIVVFASGSADDPPVWATLVTIAFVMVYETMPVALWGRTVGKAVVGIEIVTLASGQRASVVASAARAVPIVVLLVLLQQFAPIALVFLYFTAAFMKHSRGVLDLLAGTVVIESRKKGLGGLLGR